MDEENQREDKFIELTGDSRATYYRLKKKLRSASSAVPILAGMKV
jgi:hypothetical protein